MKWKPGKRSADIEDRRGQGGGFSGLGRGSGGMPIPMGRMGGGGIVTLIVIVIVYFLFLKGGEGGGFNVPDPTSSFPQVPASGSGTSFIIATRLYAERAVPAGSSGFQKSNCGYP